MKIHLSIALLLYAGISLAAPVQFEDQSEKLGFNRGSETWGVAWGNLNMDKWPDIYNQGHRLFPRMYRNTGTGDFTDVAMEFDVNMGGWHISDTQRDAHGGAFGDFDNDGDQDYITGRLSDYYINEASTGGTLVRATLASSFQNGAWDNLDTDRALESLIFCDGQNHSAYVLIFDADGDGTADRICGGSKEGPFPGVANSLFPSINMTNDAAIGDFNNDLRTDVVVTRGGRRPAGAAKVNNTRIEGWFRTPAGAYFTFTAPGAVKFLVDGAGGGVFRDADEFNLHTSGATTASARGVSISYDSATELWRVEDVSATRQSYVRVIAENPVSEPVVGGLEEPDLAQETFHGVNTPNGFDWVFNTGLYLPKYCVSVVAADFDNDMDVDLFMACRQGVRNIANRYFDNQGDGTFVEVTNHGGEGPLGIGRGVGLSESVTTADYDLDGFIDLMITNGLLYYPVGFGGPDTLLRNQGNSNHWIQMDLIGTTSPRDAIGAKVYVTAGGITQLREQSHGYHRWSQNHQRIHVGLGPNTQVDEVRIEWPSGQVDTYTNLTADGLYDVEEGIGMNLVPVANYGPALPTSVTGDENCGQPPYDTTLGPVVQLWRDCGTNNWKLRALGGLDRLTEFNINTATGRIIGDQAISAVNGVNTTAIDTINTSTANQVEFELSVQQSIGNTKGINFNTGNLSTACLVLTGTAFDSVYVGAAGKMVETPFDFIAGIEGCDSDGDGIPDAQDPDDDNDGVLDADDAFPFDPAESADTDGDGVGDNADAFPTDASETKDSDGDGVGDNADAFPADPNETTDTDGDGVGDNSDAFPGDPSESADTDGDGIGDNADIDRDNDGLSDTLESKGTLDNPFTQLGMSRSVDSPGVYYFDLGGVTFSTYVDAQGYILVANDRGNGIGALPISANLALSQRGVLSVTVLSALTQANEVRVSHSAGLLDATNDAAVLLDLVRQGKTLFRGMVDNGIGNVGWQGVGASVMNATATCDRPQFGDTLDLHVASACGNANAITWVPWDGRNYQRVDFSAGEIADNEWLRLWVAAPASSTTHPSDADLDGVPNAFDLDSDNDSIPDVIEAGLVDTDADARVDNITLQGSVMNPPDTDGDGIPDFLDLESNNPLNNGTAYDVVAAGNGNLDTNNDGRINAGDLNGGNDADGDGIDDLVDGTLANSAPVVPNRTLVAAPGTPLAITLNGSDADNDPLVFSIDVFPANGTLSGNPPNVTYTANAGFAGSDAFTYSAFDGWVSSNAGTITLHVQPTNQQVFCGEPSFDNSVDRATFLWQDCATGVWSLRSMGGGTPNRLDFTGEISVIGGLQNLIPVQIEASDTLDNSTPNRFVYNLIVYQNSIDGFDFELSAEACFTPDASSSLPIYLGQTRALLTTDDISLTTGDACTTPVDSDGDGLSDAEEVATFGTNPNLADTDAGGVDDGQEVANGTDPLDPNDDTVAGACGEPTVNNSTEPGLYAWQDCSAGGTDALWHIQVVGGGLAWGPYVGDLISDVTLTAIPQGLENNDTLDTVMGDLSLDFQLFVGGAGTDRFTVSVPAGTSTCLSISDLPVGSTVQIGRNRTVQTGDFNLEDLGTCAVSPPSPNPQCGEPTVNAATEPGIYLWQDCAVTGSKAWSVRVVGGGLPWGETSGTITASSTLTATPVLLEPNDTLDSMPGDGDIDFSLFVGGSGRDGFDTEIPASANSCFDTTVLPAGSDVFVGKDKQRLTPPFNLENLGVCN